MIRRTATAAALLTSLLAITPAARAQTAQATPDKASIWTIQGENASISAAKITDRYYTNGLRIGWVSPEGYPPDALDHVGRLLWGPMGQQRLAIDVTQQIYTPLNTALRVPPVNDRPYAGTLIAHATLMQDNANTRSLLGVGLGLMGPEAGGEAVQNGFHDLIGQKTNKGWATQLRDEPVLQFTSERTWRLPMGTVGGLETDALPDLTAELGTLRIFGQTGARFRIGQGLSSDYGPARLRPGQTGSDAYTQTQPLVWYAFLGADGRAVLRDGTIQGNIFQSSRSAKPADYVAELEAGFGIITHGVRITYVQVFQTAEIRHQKGGLHELGSLNLGARF